jgi:hypothetical protein
MAVTTVPRTNPDTTTLQAAHSEWETLIPFLRARGLLDHAKEIRRATTPVLRLTFANADAAAILRACGLSA